MSKRRFGVTILVTLVLALSLVCSTVPQTSDPVPLIISPGTDGIATVTPEYNVFITPPIVVDANTTFTDVVRLVCPVGYNDTIGIANLTLNPNQIKELQIFVNYSNQKIILTHYQNGSIIQNSTFTLYPETGAIMGISIIPTTAVINAGPIDPLSYNIVCSYEAALVHDVAVTNVVPSVSEAYPTWTIQVNVTVMNNGTIPASFNVTAYYNVSTWCEIGTQNVTDLASGAQTTLTFNWNLSSVPICNRTIKANATLAGDANLANNEGYSWVKVKWLGDVNNDGSTNVLDIVLCCINMGPVTPANIQCDLNGDGSVNVIDIVKCCISMGTYVCV